MEKSKKIRKWLLAAAALVLMITLSACGGGGNNEGGATGGEQQGGDNGNAAEAPIGSRNPDPATVIFYNASNSNATKDAFLSSPVGEAVQQKFPHINIEFLATGKGMTPAEVLVVEPNIDIVINSIYSYAALQQSALLSDVTDLIKKYDVDLDRFDPTTIEFQQRMGDGAIFGLPMATTTAVLFYNRAIFDRFGVNYPTDGMSWDDAYQLAVDLTRVDEGKQYYGFATRYPFMYNTNQLGLSYYDPAEDKLTINNDGFRTFIENFARFYRINGNEDAVHTNFWQEENVAMIAWQIGNWNHVDWDVVSLPYFKEAPDVGPQSYSTFWNVASTSKNRDLAFEILQYVTSDEYQIEAAKAGSGPGVISPAVIEAFGAEADGTTNTRDLRGKNLSAFFPSKRADTSNITIYDNVIAKHMNKAFDAVAAGTTDINTALREAEEAAKLEIEAMK